MIIRVRNLTLLATMLLSITACQKHDNQEKGNETGKASTPEVTPPKVLVQSTPSAAPAAVAPVTVPQSTATASPPPDPIIVDARGKAGSIDAKLPTLEARNGQWQAGDTRGLYSAHLEGSDVIHIEERTTAGDYGESTNRYYFESGILVLYEDDGRWREINPPNPLTTKSVRRTMVFSPEGRLITAAKAVDGGSAGLGEYEAVAVLSHAQELRAAAMKTAEAPQPAAEKPAKEAKTTAATAAKKPAADKTGPAGGGRVKFETGKSSAELKGSIPAHGGRDYLVNGKAGQVLTVKLTGADSATFGVYSSRGEIVANLREWSGKLPRDGDYTIRVAAKAGDAAAEFSLSVALQ